MVYATVTRKLLDKKIYETINQVRHKKKQRPNIEDIYDYMIKVHVLVKGATKSYFTLYSCVVIVLFNMALCRPAFSIVSFAVSFGKQFFCLSVFSVFFFVLNQIF